MFGLHEDFEVDSRQEGLWKAGSFHRLASALSKLAPVPHLLGCIPRHSFPPHLPPQGGPGKCHCGGQNVIPRWFLASLRNRGLSKPRCQVTENLVTDIIRKGRVGQAGLCF